jgi:hypothetical protein
MKCSSASAMFFEMIRASAAWFEAQGHFRICGQWLQQRNRPLHIKRAHQAEGQMMPRRRFPEQVSRRVGVVDDAAGHGVELFGRFRRGHALLVADE